MKVVGDEASLKAHTPFARLSQLLGFLSRNKIQLAHIIT